MSISRETSQNICTSVQPKFQSYLFFSLFRVSGQPTAADVVNSLDETDLAKIIRKYGEETRAKKIAHGIVQARSAFGRINTTKELATVVESCAG